MSLQFYRATDYFLVMLNIGRGGRRAGFLPRPGPLRMGMLLLAGGCDDRERLTFPTPIDGVGPVTTIEQPAGDRWSLDDLHAMLDRALVTGARST